VYIGNSATTPNLNQAEAVVSSAIDSGTLFVSLEGENNVGVATPVAAQLTVNGVPVGTPVVFMSNGLTQVAEAGLSIAPGSMITLAITEIAGQGGGFVTWSLIGS